MMGIFVRERERTNERTERAICNHCFSTVNIHSPNEYSAQKFLSILFVSVLFRMAYLGAQTVYVWCSHGHKMYTHICGIWSYRHHSKKKIHTFISIICKLSNKKYVDNNNSNRNYHQEQELEPHQPNKRKEYDGNSFAYRISVNEWIARRNGSKCKIKRYNSNKCHLFSVFSLLLPFSFSNTSFCDFPSSCSPLIYLYERRACVCLARFWASQIFYAADWYRWILSIGMRKQYFYWIF